MDAPDQKAPPAKPKLKKTPRSGESYRANRKKAARDSGQPMIRLGDPVQEGDTPSIELNRSQNFTRAQSYSYAREISPSKEPVR